MNYRGYSFRLSGVYKVENNKKLYSLEIFQGTKQVFKTDHIYKDKKRAFKDAKEMINKNSFDTEIIRNNTKKENLKNDTVYKNLKINKFANSVIIISIILMLISYIITLIGFKNIGNEFLIFIGLYAGLGILFSIIMLYWGIYTNGGFELNYKQRKIHSAIWWLNLLFNFNKGPIILYNEQPFKDKQKGWYSSTSLIALIIEALIGIFIILECMKLKNYSLLFYGTITSYTLLTINYIFSIVWEVSDAKSKGNNFPFKRVIAPILTILAILLFILYIAI